MSRFWVLVLAGFLALLVSPGPRAQAPSSPLTAWAVTIVIPPRVVAGQPATLATLGVDGKLASGVAVEVAGLKLTSDRTGRASFVVPAAGRYIIAKASGASVAALEDASVPANNSHKLAVSSVVSLHDRFSICGAGLSGDAYDNIVKINDQFALSLAASPECVVVLAGPKATPGPSTISLTSPGIQATATTALVSLDFLPPNPSLLPGRKGEITVRAQGSDEKLQLVVENETPGVLRFQKGDAQEVITAGGAQNSAAIRVEAITSGDFSFHARLVPMPDVDSARRYLEAAETLAPKEQRDDIKKLADRLAHHPRDFRLVANRLNEILSSTIAGDFRTLLEAARESL